MQPETEEILNKIFDSFEKILCPQKKKYKFKQIHS